MSYNVLVGWEMDFGGIPLIVHKSGIGLAVFLIELTDLDHLFFGLWDLVVGLTQLIHHEDVFVGTVKPPELLIPRPADPVLVDVGTYVDIRIDVLLTAGFELMLSIVEIEGQASDTDGTYALGTFDLESHLHDTLIKSKSIWIRKDGFGQDPLTVLRVRHTSHRKGLRIRERLTDEAYLCLKRLFRHLVYIIGIVKDT